MKRHDRVLAYGSTYKTGTYPLVLVIGREPSFNADQITDNVGEYDFDRVSSSSFWNVAYRYLAPAGGVSDTTLKSRCRIANASPIVVGDSLPIGVENGDRDVSAKRGEVPTTDIDDHVFKTLQLAQTSKRVKLIVLAGHLSGARGNNSAKAKLKYANQSYKNAVANISNDIEVIDTPFLTNLNSTNLTKCLATESTSQRLQHIFTDFFLNTSGDATPA